VNVSSVDVVTGHSPRYSALRLITFLRGLRYMSGWLGGVGGVARFGWASAW